ncbi:MAG: site-specific DNA-methyltransferase [Treponema sp.]|nr:site-specific DNA-methyltransferase [Treponema sp.]
MPIKYIPFFPEPIEGQAILDNFKRTLRYKGAYDVADKLRRGMPYYEVEKQENVGENKNGNLVIRGECVSACAYLREQGIKIDLVYIDPPFASGADYAKKVYIRRNPKVAEAIEKTEKELDIDELKAFEEKMYGDVWDKEKYLNWMYENLMAIKSVMSETASIYVHLDWHIGHYVKVLMDEILGEDNFRNEIAWHYRTGNLSFSNFQRKHDTILFYAHGEDAYFQQQTVKEYYTQIYGPDKKISMKGPNDATDEYGDYKISQMDDVWDIPSVFTLSGEHKAYATQKPEALLERIIKASSSEGMVVADFFSGSGVTAAVANKLGRKFITSDIGINAIQTTRDRLKADGAGFDLLEIKDGVSLYRNPVQTMDKIKSLIPGLKNEDSLDAFWEGAISDSKLGTVPVYVPNLMDSSTKLLDVVLMNRILHEAIPDLDNIIKKVIVYYVDIVDRAEIEKFIKDDDSTLVEIELRDLKEILDDVVINDYVEYDCKESNGNYTLTFNKFVSDRVNQKIDEFNQKAFINSSEKKPYKPIVISDESLELIELISVDCSEPDGEWHSDSEIKIDKNGFVILNGTKTKQFWDGKITCDKKPLRLKIRNICGDESVIKID